jgi:hypothetical protein
VPIFRSTYHPDVVRKEEILERAVHAVAEQATKASTIINEAVGAGLDGSHPVILHTKMLRLELLNVKADLDRELGRLVLNCLDCGRRVHWVPGLGTEAGHWAHREPHSARAGAIRRMRGAAQLTIQRALNPTRDQILFAAVTISSLIALIAFLAVLDASRTPSVGSRVYDAEVGDARGPSFVTEPDAAGHDENDPTNIASERKGESSAIPSVFPLIGELVNLGGEDPATGPNPGTFPGPQPTPSPSPSPSPNPSVTPTPSPSDDPSPMPEPSPSSEPSPETTEDPEPEPTVEPEPEPTVESEPPPGGPPECVPRPHC